MTAVTLLQAQAADTGQDSLLQYGALGAVLILAIMALYKILAWASNRTAGEMERAQQELATTRERHREQIAHERMRSDRLETELRELNRTVTDRVVPALVKATDVLESSFRRRDDR